MQQIPDPPPNWGRILRCERETAGGLLCIYKPLYGRTNLSWGKIAESGRMALDVIFKRFSQDRLFANTAYRASSPIHVTGDRASAVFLHPCEEIGLGRESFATRKQRA